MHYRYTIITVQLPLHNKGYPPAEAASDKYHGVPKFDVATGMYDIMKSMITNMMIYT